MKETPEHKHKLANENLRRTIRLTRDMLALAYEGDRDRLDDSCGILYGLLRDMAYRLRKTAEEECQKHIQSGTWDGKNVG
jgi:hypothetical protein